MAAFGDIGSTVKFPTPTSLPNEFPLEAVVISFQNRDAILLDESPVSYPSNRRGYFRLKPSARCVGEKRQLQLRDVVRVLTAEDIEVARTRDGKELDLVIAPCRRATSYEIVSEKPVPEYEEVVATHQETSDYITVVGRSFGPPTAFFKTTRPSEKQDSPGLGPGHFAMVKAYKLRTARQRVATHPETGDSFHYFVKIDEEKLEKEDKETAAAMSHFPGDFRLLSHAENDWIMTRLRTRKDVDLAVGRLYIRDPAIAAQRLEDAMDFEEASKMVMQKCAYRISRGAEGRTSIQFRLDENETRQFTKAFNNYKWRKGVQVAVGHDELNRQSDLMGHMIFENIVNSSDYTVVTLEAEERSKDLLKMVADFPERFMRKPFSVGAWNGVSEATIRAINKKFDGFFENERMLELYAGRKSSPPDYDVPNRDVEFLVKGKPLDRHQLDFMRSAAVVPGWTCAQAPPGCGKTHTTAALVAYLNELKVEGGVCISGTTNTSVTNAAEAVRRNFPDIRIVRTYSSKAETETTEKDKQIGLTYMALNPDQYLDDNAFEDYIDVLRDHLDAKKAYGKTKGNSYGRQFQKFQELQTTERLAKKDFLRHYNMNVYATTVEMLLRSGDIFAKIAAKKAGCEEDFLETYRQTSIKRLILDEAAQLSPVHALALYCLLDNLEYITLLGDSYQLGPQSRLQKDTPVYRFLTEGELTRMYSLGSTVKKDLNCIYRCHPEITRLMLLPIYGEKMEIGVTAEERSLAKDLDLVTGRRGSPVVFVQVEGREQAGVNQKEVARLIQLLCSLLNKKVDPADIVVICNHRAQKDTVMEELTKISRSILVTTVDSFQGKEAKVVIVLTTKTSNREAHCKNIIQFVADPKRATVAVSRAQHVLYVLGDFRSLAHSIFWARLIDNVLLNRGFIAHISDGTNSSEEKKKQLASDGNWMDSTSVMLACIPPAIRKQLKKEKERKKQMDEARAVRQQQVDGEKKPAEQAHLVVQEEQAQDIVVEVEADGSVQDLLAELNVEETEEEKKEEEGIEHKEEDNGRRRRSREADQMPDFFDDCVTPVSTETPSSSSAAPDSQVDI